jgi:hypothetical protein
MPGMQIRSLPQQEARHSFLPQAWVFNHASAQEKIKCMTKFMSENDK